MTKKQKIPVFVPETDNNQLESVTKTLPPQKQQKRKCLGINTKWEAHRSQMKTATLKKQKNTTLFLGKRKQCKDVNLSPKLIHQFNLIQ